MSLYDIVHYFFGKYVYSVPQKEFSRFANLISKKKINFWGVNYKDGNVEFSSSVFVAEELMRLSKKLYIPMEIIHKKGLPFKLSLYRKRYGLICGVFVGLFLIFFSQLFIWKIEISGNKNVSSAQIESALAECGIEIGKFIPAIDVGDSKNRLLMNCRDISSIAIGINGNHLTISVLERTYLPEIMDKTGYYNVVSEYDGIIIDIDASQGTPEVSEGDVVYKGQLLINSFMEGNNGSFRPTHASGIVYAAVNEHYEVEVPFARVGKEYTGNVQTKYFYKILGWEISSFFGIGTDYEYFDVVSSERIIRLFGFVELPIKEYRITYSEYIKKEEFIEPDMAKELAYAEFSDYISSLGLEVIECKTDYLTDNKKGTCKLVADAVLKRDIAKEVKLELNQSISDKLPNAVE